MMTKSIHDYRFPARWPGIGKLAIFDLVGTLALAIILNVLLFKRWNRPIDSKNMVSFVMNVSLWFVFLVVVGEVVHYALGHETELLKKLGIAPKKSSGVIVVPDESAGEGEGVVEGTIPSSEQYVEDDMFFDEVGNGNMEIESDAIFGDVTSADLF